ncbi:MAG: CocE/NonD family hydrolase [Mycobacterium sp.]
MGAARYVGRVGGLAVALGAGVAILLAAGTASADTDRDSKSSSSSSSTAPSSSSSAKGSDTKQRNSIKIKSATRADADRPDRRLSKSADDDTDSSAKQTRSNPTSDKDDNTTSEDDTPAKTMRATKSGNAPDTDSGHLEATREIDSGNGDTSNPGTGSGDTEHAVTQTTALTQVRTSKAAAAPTTPDPGSPASAPAEWMLAAAARRELAYDPEIALVDGVITGINNAVSSKPMTYSLVRNPSGGGKLSLQPDGDFTFLPYLSSSRPATTEKFSILMAEQTAFTQALLNIPVIKLIAPRVLVVLQQIPIVKDVLSPLIGRAEVFGVVVNVAPYVGANQAPIAFTTRIKSFDGTPISVNHFPASGLGLGEDAPTILNGPSLATAGYINLSQPNTVSGLVPGITTMREAGYNVVTWDPRGEFASGGRMHLDSENYEARDVSAIISWVSGQPGTAFEGTSDDPLIGMLGGSYGGGIQLTSAGIDPRIDAIAPGIAWNSLETALYPNNAFKTAWASLLALALVSTGARPDLEIYAGITTGVLFGFLTPGQRAFLSSNSPATVVGNITVPTMFLQGTVDGLFTLQQALDNAAALNPDVPVRMIWYCGGHGYCLDLDKDAQASQTQYLINQQLAWMDTYVKYKGTGPGVLPGPEFVWVDQNGNWFTANNLPIDGSPFFSSETIEVSGHGGLLPVLPIIGGSGPQTKIPFPISLPAAAASRHALQVEIPARPAGSPDVHVVGAPTLTLTYSGLGTSRNIYAQLVDNKTGRVLGNLVTPVPVTLDGHTRTVTIHLENIAYTMGEGDSLTLQIVDSATAYEDFTSLGLVNVSTVTITLPTAAAATPMSLPPVSAPPVAPTPFSVEKLLTGGGR